MNRTSVLTVIAAIALALAVGGCGGGGNTASRPGTFQVLVDAGGRVSVVGAAGSADAGTTVSLEAPASGSGVAAADGSVSFHGESGGANNLVVIHTHNGDQVEASTTATPISSRVTAPLFSTGQAPNDMLLAHESLYVANSLDNTVVRYSFTGGELASHTFAQFASPSYLAFDLEQETLWVARNGDNFLSPHNSQTLALTMMDVQLDHPELAGLAFIGPGAPLVRQDILIVPFSGITEFGSPTVYSDAGAAATRTLDGSDSFVFLDGELNGQTIKQIPLSAFFAIVTAGSIQFDENFIPSATSNSTLAIGSVSAGDTHFPSIRSKLDLGMIGASALAISPDGDFAYIGNQLNGNVYKADLSDLDNPQLLRGMDNPIELTDEHTYISDLQFTPDGSLLLATSFNTDELFVIDPATDAVSPLPYPGPFDVSLDPNLLAGTIGVETNGDKAWVLYSIGNAVGEVDLL